MASRLQKEYPRRNGRLETKQINLSRVEFLPRVFGTRLSSLPPLSGFLGQSSRFVRIGTSSLSFEAAFLRS